MKQNITIYKWLNFLTQAIFFIPIFVIFLQANGLSLTKVMLLQTFFSLTIIALEIPTGYFADRYGRKKSVIIASFSLLIGIIVYSLSSTFWFFVMAEILWGIGVAFMSGSGSALLYDTLIELKREREYPKEEGKAFFYARLGSLIASIIGGLIAVIHIRLPFYVMIPILAINLIMVFGFKEPKRHKRIVVVRILEIVKYSFFKNPKIRWLILFSAMINGFGTVIFWLFQPFLVSVNVPLAYFGMVFALIHIIAACTAKYAHLIERRIGQRTSLFVLVGALTLPMFLISFFMGIWSLFWIIPIEFAWAYNVPVLKDYINKLVDSGRRATVLSISSLFSMVIIAVFSPLVGLINDNFSLSGAVLFTGVTSLLFSGACLIKLRKIITH